MGAVVTQFGFTNGSGILANIADENVATSWSPLATHFDVYTDQFFIGDPSSQVLNVGKSFAHLQFDMGEPKRVPSIAFVTSSDFTLSTAVVIGSDNPSTSVANAIQAGDVLLGFFTTTQMNSKKALDLPPMKVDAIRKRYIRVLQRSTVAAVAPSPFPANTFWFDSGSGNFTVPEYANTFTIEGWGAGASGGASSIAHDGGDSTVSTYSLLAEGGNKASTNFPNAPNTCVGGIATGGNTLNLQGDPGGQPSTLNGNEGSGGGGGAAPNPNGTKAGAPGAVLGISQWDPAGIFITGSRFGVAGVAPGGGGSGANIFVPSAGGTFYKYPGGSAGGYFKHVLRRGIDGPTPGSLIAYAVGLGGAENAVGGRGANGRISFSWD